MNQAPTSRTRRALSSTGLAVVLLVSIATASCSARSEQEESQPAAGDASSGSSPTPEQRPRDPYLGIGTGWGPSRAEIRRAVRLTRAMTTRELAGQVIVTDYLGTAAPVDLVDGLHLGGVILFDYNMDSSAAARQQMRTLRRSLDRPWPLWISADQEGGLVERLQDDLTRFPSFMSAGAVDRPAVVRAAARASGSELAWLGLTADFAPVADVTAGSADPTIGSRSASEFSKRAARAVTAAARGYLDAGVVPVVKHFPGHGSAPTDSHLTLPVIDRPRSGLRSIDLRPFRAAVDAGVPSVMVGHLDVRAIDPGRASSLSSRVVTGLLRGRLGFEGLVTTDALDMMAVTERAGSALSAVRALRAGVDLLVMPPDPRVARDGILAAVRSQQLPLRRLRQAAARQGALMLHRAARVREGAAPAPRPPGSARGASWRLSRAAVTQVAGTCGVRHVGDRVFITGPADDVAVLGSAFRTYGVEVYEPPAPPELQTPPESDTRDPGGDDEPVDPSPEPSASPAPVPADVTRVAVTGYRGGPVSGDVVVATDTPWSLTGSTAPVKIAAYGDTTGAMRAVVQVLLGRRAPGSLPVRINEVEKGC